MKQAAITGHTSGLGASFYKLLDKHGYEVHGFSRSNGYDLRDYSQVSYMLEQIKEFDLFVNNAKPEYTQAQIVYRLARDWHKGTVLSIGSQAAINLPEWTDTFLLEYLTQKTALIHAHQVLKPVVNCQLLIVHPHHLDNNTDQYVEQIIKELNL
jgi:NAD(P)-dependent dehydrogenase (short-subunit alcohol dehydrogenase family)